jgi:Lar family restriction alleviation protein
MIKPCPFCGSAGVIRSDKSIFDDWNGYLVTCSAEPYNNCSVSPFTGLFKTKKEALKEWNTRKENKLWTHILFIGKMVKKQLEH